MLEIITQERLKELLAYCPITGQFTWLKARHTHVRFIGQRAGTENNYGYRKLALDGQRYAEHRLAWLYMYGKFPDAMIDHINGVKSDNRIANLREASATKNRENQRKAVKGNKVGLLGVCFHKGRFMANIKTRGKQRTIGGYPTAELAHEAYLTEKRSLHEGCTI